MVPSNPIAILVTSFLGLVAAAKCKPHTTLSTLTTTGSWLTGVPAPSSTLTGAWLGSSNTESVPEPAATPSGALRSSSEVVPIGNGGFVPLSCYPNPATLQSSVCAVEGFVDANWIKFAYSGPAADDRECLRDCTITNGCTAYAYDKHGDCFINTLPWTDAHFTKDNAGGGKDWSQVECYECYDNSVLKLDFEDGYFEDWGFEWNDEFLWFMDSPAVPESVGRALRVGEPQGADTKGDVATVTYLNTFHLNAGTQYTFGFRMRVLRNNYLIKNYDAVTFMISTNDEIVYEYTPQRTNDENLQDYQKFTLHSSESGEATLSIVVTGSGHGYDYYFDHLFVTWGI
ncbi:hypothetical protein G7Z17_g6495 [Cylindrodendrum hubeiense]|uniref:Apple domain-containing protein n=1 Tax=Cylindrodendrum hubeiense TaxID=595255 RepID=A0A9P5LAR8_9HYPO|nr:hypothetical protein G7Z17_g6495 [Cylindrodendrum hubeiense]